MELYRGSPGLHINHFGTAALISDSRRVFRDGAERDWFLAVQATFRQARPGRRLMLAVTGGGTGPQANDPRVGSRVKRKTGPSVPRIRGPRRSARRRRGPPARRGDASGSLPRGARLARVSRARQRKPALMATGPCLALSAGARPPPRARTLPHSARTAKYRGHGLPHQDHAGGCARIHCALPRFLAC